MIRQPDDHAVPQHLHDRVLDRLAGLLVDDGEDFRKARPAASSSAQPDSSSATALRNLTRPLASVLITASPMLASVTRSRSRCSCMSRAFSSAAASAASSARRRAFSSACFRSVMSLVIFEKPRRRSAARPAGL